MSTRTYDGPPLHDPATYAHGFPYDVFRELRDHDPVSHQRPSRSGRAATGR